jgi:hypothetical protein
MANVNRRIAALWNPRRRGYSERSHYERSWYRNWLYAPGPRWYPGRTGVWIEVVYVRSPDRWRRGARAVRCSMLSDELDYAHDEWHWRNDQYRWDYWYDQEHEDLMWALDTEWRRAGCGGRAPLFYDHRRDRDWGLVRTAARVVVALEILDILFDGDWHH